MYFAIKCASKISSFKIREPANLVHIKGKEQGRDISSYVSRITEKSLDL